MSLLRRAAAAVTELRGAPPGSAWGDSTPPSNGMLGGPNGLPSMGDKGVMAIGAMWACARVLADGLATLPLRQYKGGKGPGRTEIDLSPVIEDPYGEGTALDFRAMGQVSLLCRGNYFGQIVDRDKRMLATQIQPLPPSAVTVRRNKDTGLVEYRVGGKVVPTDDMFHIKNLAWPGELVGMNPIEELRTTFTLARAAEAYGAAWFQNSANPSGILTSEDELDDDQTLTLARAWMASHQGLGKAYMPAVLSGGVTWQQVSVNPADAAFIESRNLSRSDVAMICGVPPYMVGDVEKSTSFGRGIEQQSLSFVVGTLAGYMGRWEHAQTALLPQGEYVEFDLRRRLRGDSVQRASVITMLRNAGIINADEGREYEDLPPIPDGKGQVWLQPLNMGDAGVPAGVPDPGGSA